MRMIEIEGDASIAELLEDLDLLPSDLPKGYVRQPSEDVTVTISVSADAVADILTEVGFIVSDPDDGGLAAEFDEGDVMGLAAAIRRGDRSEAEILLDRLMSVNGRMSELVQLGRYSRAADSGHPALPLALPA